MITLNGPIVEASAFDVTRPTTLAPFSTAI